MDPRPSRPPSGRERREAASELRVRREWTGIYAIAIGLFAVVALPLGVRELGAGWIWLEIVFGLGLCVSAMGVWRAAEWARISSGILLLLAAAAVIAFGIVARGSEHEKDAGLLARVVVFGPGLWLLLPRTRDEFRRTRESMHVARRSAG